MPGDRSFHLIEAVPDRMEGAPVAQRRRWSDAFKAEMVARSLEPSVNVSALAREIGISPSQLFGWRTEAIKRGEVAKRDDDAGVVAATQTERGMIEIEVSGVVVRMGSDFGEAHLRRVIRAPGEGQQRWPAVHALDAAVMFRLALERGEPGTVWHAVADEGVKVHDIATVIGRKLGLSVVPAAVETFGALGPIFAADQPASSAHTRQALGWKPTRPNLLADLEIIVP